MFLLVETTLKVCLCQQTLFDPFTSHLMSKFIASGYCFVRTWFPSSANLHPWVIFCWFSNICPLTVFFLVGVQATDEEFGGSFPGGLFPRGARWVGGWHHRCSGQTADRWWWEGDQQTRPCWIPVTQHQSEVNCVDKMFPTYFAASSAN